MNSLRLTIAVSVSAAAWSSGAPEDIDFNRGIKPILSGAKRGGGKCLG